LAYLVCKRRWGESKSHAYPGKSPSRHVWLIYRPDLGFLKSSDSALTLSRAKAIAETKPSKPRLVYAAARFVSQRTRD
jgi:adenine-specific DNA-methyltransferase